MISPLGHSKSYEFPDHSSLKSFGLNLTNKNKAWNLNGFLVFKLDSHPDMLLRSMCLLCTTLYLIDKCLSCSCCYDDRNPVELLPL